MDNVKFSEPCLICSCQQPSLITLPLCRIVPQGLVRESVINDNLWQMFLLRRVLQMPQEECEKLLMKSYGLNPISWFRLCDTCTETVNDAFLIYCHMLELEHNMKGLRIELEEKMKMSLQSEKMNPEGGDELIFSPMRHVREYYRETFDQLTENKLQCDTDMGTSGSFTMIIPIVKTESDDSNSSIGDESHEENELIENHGKASGRKSKKLEHVGYLETRKANNLDVVAPDVAPGARKLIKTKTPFFCSQCQMYYSSAKGLKLHQRKYHSISSSGKSTFYRCKHCTSKFIIVRALQNHLRSTHASLFKLKCDKCDACYKTSGKLIAHRKSCHS